jgi:hypothetical protein
MAFIDKRLFVEEVQNGWGPSEADSMIDGFTGPLFPEIS